MSKKTQKKHVVKEEVVEVKEQQTKGEKIFTYIIYGIATFSLILILIFSINFNGDRGKLARKYDSLPLDNVFEIVTFKELNKMIENGETFDLLLINTLLDESSYYIYCTDLIAKNIQNSEDGYKELNKIYVFQTAKIKDEQVKFFKKVKYNILKSPNIISYAPTIDTYSVPVDSTVFYDKEDYNDNSYYLLLEYFKNVYSDIEESYE